jgi:hypothetical protein
MLTLVAGVEPAAPGFASIRVAPHLGPLEAVTASFPHPKGAITVDYHRKGTGLDATVTLPTGLSGTFVFKGKVSTLKAGSNQIQVR